MELVPYYYVLDFESALHRIHEVGKNHTKIHRHVCASFSWVCVDTKGNKVSGNTFIQSHDDENPIRQAIQEMLDDSKIRIEKIKESQMYAKKKMKFSAIDTKDIMLGASEKLKECIFCQLPFTKHDFDSGNVAADHHHHEPYMFRGYAHLKCNSKCQISYKFPCVLIGGSNYDEKLICQVLHHFRHEKYILFQKHLKGLCLYRLANCK